MAINFECTCGHALRASPDAVGKKTKCPVCGQILIIPAMVEKPVAASPILIPQAEAEPDPFAQDLDWTTMEAPRISEASRPASGLIKIDTGQEDMPSDDIARTDDGSRQYRVLSQKDQGYSGKFSAANLEQMLNTHAKSGWTLKAAVTMSFPGHGGNHDEMIVIMER